MYTGLLHTHSLLRYLVLIFLVLVIILAISGVAGKRPFGKWDNKASLFLLIFTHIQTLVGLFLYFVSPEVKFGPDTMTTYRYWTVEHIFAMLIAVVLITIGRVSMKKISIDAGKHKRLLIMNLIALIVIVATILMSGRPLV
jgi:hypothetical protein